MALVHESSLQSHSLKQSSFGTSVLPYKMSILSEPWILRKVRPSLCLVLIFSVPAISPFWNKA